MGNGRSGLSNGGRAYKSLSKQAKGLGYTVTNNKELRELLGNVYDKEAVQAQFKALHDYYSVLGYTPNAINSITYSENSAGGAASVDQAITVSSWAGIYDEDMLVHEHTHNIVSQLITKEFGYTVGSPEYIKTWREGAIERDIQDEAYKAYYKEVYKDEFSDRFVSPSAVKYAVEDSHMRDYATKQYEMAKKGTYVEIPTVAAECFHKVNYNWTELHKKYPYAYYVMREIYSRIHK